MLAVAAATVYLPGLAIMFGFGVRQRLVLLGAAPAASVGVALIVASASALLDVGYGPTPLAVGTVLLTVVGFGINRLVHRQFGPPADLPPPRAKPLLPRLSGITSILAQLAGLVFVLTGAGLALRAWTWGLGTWNTYNQDHDTILALVLTSYIQRTGRGAPWQIMPADVVVGRPTVYYPDGFHLMAATVADVFDGNAVVGMNAAAAMLIGAAWTTSAAALAALAVRWLRDDPGWMALAGGVAAVVAAGLYRPGVVMARDNGLLPNAAALVLVPGVLAALLLIRPKLWSGGMAVGVACAGIVAVHPSAGLSVGLSVALFWIALLFVPDGRAMLRAQWSVLLVIVVSASAAAAGVLHGALAVSSRIGAFPPDTAHWPFAKSLGHVVPLIYGGMFDAKSLVQVWPTALLLIGLATALAMRRAVPVLVAWTGWVIIVLLAYRNPTGITAPILGFFYNSVGRLQSHIQLFAPALAALGAFGLLAALIKGVGAIRLPRIGRLGTRVAGLVGVAAMFVVTAFYISGPDDRYLRTTAAALSERWADPQLYRVDDKDIAAADWLRSRVAPGERIMNSPNDGSTWLYVHYGLPIVEVSTLGVPGFPYTWELMKSFRYLDTDPEVRRRILDLHIGWVYVDSRAPIIGAFGAPDDWTGGGLMTTVAGLRDLDDTPGLILAHVEGGVQIYKVDLDYVRGLEDTGGQRSVSDQSIANEPTS